MIIILIFFFLNFYRILYKIYNWGCFTTPKSKLVFLQNHRRKHTHQKPGNGAPESWEDYEVSVRPSSPCGPSTPQFPLMLVTNPSLCAYLSMISFAADLQLNIWVESLVIWIQCEFIPFNQANRWESFSFAELVLMFLVFVWFYQKMSFWLLLIDMYHNISARRVQSNLKACDYYI